VSAMTTGPLLQQIVVSTDYDVITMRQEIRLNARSFGMVLSQQARITAAVSAVARTMYFIERMRRDRGEE